MTDEFAPGHAAILKERFKTALCTICVVAGSHAGADEFSPLAADVIAGSSEPTADAGRLHVLFQLKDVPRNYELRFNLQVETGTAVVAVRTAKSDDVARGYRIVFSHDGTSPVFIEDAAGSRLADAGQQVVVDSQGLRHTVGTLPKLPPRSNGRQDVAIRLKANHVEVRVNRRRVLDLIDQRFHRRSLAGQMKLALSGEVASSASFRDVRLREIPGIFAPYEGDDALALLTGQALRADEIELAAGFRAELVYSVPRETQGSWVAMTFTAGGDIVTAAHDGNLYRVRMSDAGRAAVDKINLEIGGAQGLLWAGGALYVVVNGHHAKGPGLYRVQDTSGDGQLDSVELLKRFTGSGDHGPHGLVLAPGGRTMYIVAGNDTKLPEGIGRFLPPPVWGEDQLLPRMSDPTGFATWNLAPNGWICRTDLDGQDWELVAMGLRNAYDLAFNRVGELFTFDSDMEWDVGLPWYRPTRVCQVVSGADFGYRHGSGKLPPYYADTLPAAVEVGTSSPTGVVFGTNTHFPARYQRALFALDWAYGTIYAVHLQPQGASYRGTFERFAVGRPLPVADAEVGPDGALYFVTGGRGTQSGLYRITYDGEQLQPRRENSAPTDAAQLRRKLEQLHNPSAHDAIAVAWPHLAHDDRFVRYAARIAVEHQPLDQWIDRVCGESHPRRAIEALLAAVRHWPHTDRQSAARIYAKIQRLPFAELTTSELLDALRVIGLAHLRLGDSPGDELQPLLEKLEPLFPHTDPRITRELCALLVAFDSEIVVSRGVAQLAETPDRAQQVALAVALRTARLGWTPRLRRAYLAWFSEAIAQSEGSATFQQYLRQARDEMVAMLSEYEHNEYAILLADRTQTSAHPVGDQPRVVRRWQMVDVVPMLGELAAGRSFERGKIAFEKAQCYECHRFAGAGSNRGPDLTGAGARYSARDLAEAIVEPSKVIADMYRSTIFVTATGRAVVGRVVFEDEQKIRIQPDQLGESAVEIAVDEIIDRQPSPQSPMPAGGIDVLTRRELLDLLAYLQSGGDASHPAYQSESAP